MIENLKPCMQEALGYFIEIGAILPNETLDAVPLRNVPTSKQAMIKLVADITRFAMTGKVEKPSAAPNIVTHGPPAITDPPIEVPREPETPPQTDGNYDLTQYPFNIIIPVPRKGMNRQAYMKAPDTIGSLFAMRHGDDEESASARRRLWGFINHYTPATWVNRQGQTMMPSDSDIAFRKALDALADMLERNGEKL